MNKKLLIPLFVAGMAIPAFAQKGEIKAADAYYIGEYGEKNAYIEHGKKVNGQLADEGFVLLKNDGTFPLAKGCKITVAGKSSVDLARGGGGSGVIKSFEAGKVTLEQSLTDAGYLVNETATQYYKNAPGGRQNGNTGYTGDSQVTIGETPISDTMNELNKNNSELARSFDEYNDLAIQVITREGSEGCDVLTVDATDDVQYGSSEKHALELSDNEQALFDLLTEKFENVLIIINSSNIFECEQFENNSKVSGILWIGNPGDVGPGAVGRILCGDVNPSGRTVDTWTRDFTQDPTWQNFSDNRHTTNTVIPNHKGHQNHQSADTMFNADGTPMRSYGTRKQYTNTSEVGSNYLEDEQYKVMAGGLNGVKPAAYVSYEEGIYLDYRYYETRYADMAKKDQAAADTWYNSEKGVLYPFGYGLSYTKFEQKIVGIKPAKNSTLDEETDLIEVKVKVTNVGSCAGKDAVQIYWKAPYYDQGIEKADHVLCAFDKTKMLNPNESQYVNLTFHLQDVANYDFTDANKNGHTGYELDAGDYSIMCMKNAHTSYDKVDLKVKDGGIQYDTDRYTNYPVVNRFTNNGFYSSMPGPNDIEFTQMSRSDFDGTFPTSPTFEDRKVKEGSRFEEFLMHEYDLAAFEESRDNYEYTPEQAHKTAEDGQNWRQAANSNSHTIKLADMLNYPLSDEKWEEFINEFTWSELMLYVETNKMSSPGLSSIGYNGASEGDGPQQFSIMAWVSSPIIAATFNPRLAHEQGECIGMESQIQGKAGWWGCAVNTHRSPFGGRNFEYYSADPFLMGTIAANVVGAATDRGVFAYFKHFAVNDQEKNRESGISFVNEQALREIYLKSFQIVFQEGKATGVMASYNRLGLLETAANYNLLTEVLRNEWGFNGAVLSDMTHSGNSNVNFKCYECVTPRVLAGCNCQLDSGGFGNQTQTQAKWDANANGGKGAPVCVQGAKGIAWSFWYACRQAVKQHLHMVLHSTAMQRGMVQVVGQSDLEANVTDNFSRDVSEDLKESGIVVGEDVNVYSNRMAKSLKTIKSIDSYELNERVVLPEGITFDGNSGIIEGKFKYSGLVRIDVIVNVTFEDDKTGQIAYKYVIDVASDIEEEKVKEEIGCSSSIVAASALVSTLAIAGAILLKAKRKED